VERLERLERLDHLEIRRDWNRMKAASGQEGEEMISLSQAAAETMGL
jgi:hypothetical protein